MQRTQYLQRLLEAQGGEMTYLEKVMSDISFDTERLSAYEIERLREIIGWQIRSQLCPSDITFLKGPGPNKCPLRDARACRDQCWDTEAAANE